MIRVPSARCGAREVVLRAYGKIAPPGERCRAALSISKLNMNLHCTQ